MASADSLKAISPLLNTTFNLLHTSPVIGQLLRHDIESCSKYLTSLRKRVGPFLDAADNFNGSWSANTTTLNGITVQIHNVQFTGCRFVIIVCAHAQNEKERRMVIFSRSSRQLQNVLANWVEMYFDVVVRPMSLSGAFIAGFVDSFVGQCMRMEDSSSLQLEFTTGMKELRRITIGLEPDEVQKLATTAGIMTNVYNHMLDSTGIKFDQLDLGKAGCGAGAIEHSGKIKFSSRANTIDWLAEFVTRLIGQIAGQVWHSGEDSNI
ncbi:hypothetical protein V1512DRAFT_258527 [Lipomyces arxii]|uniref:uncharacterized protein n=1 Tax=Lipomyces arxii TaxID=56418 RepID=UPI0034CE7F43